MRNDVIPGIVKNLRSVFSDKLRSAQAVSLIVDLWTNKINKDFIALSAVIINKEWNRELLILDMRRMDGMGHNAENIQRAVEIMVNRYDFDKSKISSNLNLNL